MNILRPGTYSITVTDIFGYASSDTINISLPQRPLLTGNQYVCLNQPKTFTIDSLPNYIYVWNANDTTRSFTTGNPGTYFYNIYDTLGCAYTDSIEVIIDSIETQLDLGPDLDLCTGNKLFPVNTGNYPITSYLWSTQETTPFATVGANSGFYSVTVTNSNGCTAQDIVFVNVLGFAPQPNFSYTDTCFGNATQFTDLTTVQGGAVDEWAWHFEVADSAFIANPSHVFSNYNSYQVTLWVHTTDGCAESITKTVIIEPSPEANLTAGISCANTETRFIDISTVPYTNITSWEWDFGGTGNSTQRNPQHVFPAQGIYIVTYKVTTNKGCTDEITRSIEVYPELIADFEAAPLCLGNPTRFTDKSLSLSIVAQKWDFDDGFSSTLKNLTRLFPDTGSYEVKLTVTNAIGCVSDTIKTITIYDSPEADFTVENLCVGEVIQFNDATDTQGDSIILYYWNFGDGYPEIKALNPQYRYDSIGTYQASLKILSASGCSDSITKPVTIYPLPEADFRFTPDFGGAPLTVFFSNESSADAAVFRWEFEVPSGNISLEENPSYIFTQNGSFDVLLEIETAQGCKDFIVKTVSVVPSLLDIAVTNVIVNQELMNDGNYKVITVAKVRNLGTRNVSYFDILNQIGDGATVVESWEGFLEPAQAINYAFESKFVSALERNRTFVCVEARNPNGEEDDNPLNNKFCIALEDQIKILPLYPVPADQLLNMDIILPKNAALKIEVFNVLGARMNAEEVELIKGFNRLTLNTARYAAGIYLIKFSYEEEVYERKFEVLR